MKSTKQFLSLALLLSSMSAFAAQVGQCTGPCDTTPPKCRKKQVSACNVDTNTLLARKDATVCGDLTVNGQIHNLELQLMRDAGVPPTDEVYTQFYQQIFAQNILENIQEFFVPRDINVPGTEIYDNAPIYGYVTIDGEQVLTLTGGPELSYNAGFEGVDVRYHGQNPEEIVLTTPDNMQAWYEHAFSYLIQRGFPMPGIDVYPQFEGQFIYNNNRRGAPFYPFFGIKFQYGEESLIPVAVDFLISSGQATITSLALYEPDVNLRENGLYYPMRIPVTADFAEFNSKFNKESIVYYDDLHRRITIHVPECNNSPIEISKLKLDLTCCNCNLELDFTDNIISFDGTFNLMRRNGANQLVSSGFDQLEYLIQASSVIGGKTLIIDHGEPFEFTQEYNFSEPGGVFTGIAIPLMNGETPQTDVYTFNPGILNAFSASGDPLVLPQLGTGPNSFQAGDNPITTIQENLGTSFYNTFFDTELWSLIIPGLPLYVLDGTTYPEQNGDQNIVPLPEFPVAPTKIFDYVVGHEYVHNSQRLQGYPLFLPTEGQAAGVELDPKLNNGVFSSLRQDRWTQYLIAMIRSDWPLTLPELAAINVSPGIPTYGSSIFWRYLATQFDYNYQTMRRMSDIISHETLNPLLKENGVTFYDSATIYGGEIGYNPAGSLLALDQALHELHGKNVQDVFSNFAVSLAMLRNNTSIPKEYRHEYPYWLCSPTYPGYQNLARLFPEYYAAWWQNYQDNTILPDDPELPQYDGQNFMPILEEDVIDFETQDMTMLLFEVPADVNTVTVDITEGEWRLSVVQFTSDGTPVGQFIIDGPHANSGGQTVFDMSQFPRNPESGSVRLVCANVGIHDYEGLNNWCGAAPIMTGKISILRS